VSIDPSDIDVDALTPEEFIGMVHAHSDAEVRSTFQSVGADAALDRIFGMMPEYYRPDRVGDVDATVQWRINDGAQDHHYVIEFQPDACETWQGVAEQPTAAISTDIVRFARIVTGQANPVKLLVTRKLKASGDVMFARRIAGFFDIPTA
jgi:alkyl sulfatase BDS1-like metallo-beta-lactamase superfamily hydrolase